jgi:hypothetical protein
MLFLATVKNAILQVIIEDINRIFRHWFEYFNHSTETRFAVTTAGRVCGYPPFSANGMVVPEAGRGAIINAGLPRTLACMDCSLCKRPMLMLFNPYPR